jgi:hypothetical protein
MNSIIKQETSKNKQLIGNQTVAGGSLRMLIQSL